MKDLYKLVLTFILLGIVLSACVERPRAEKVSQAKQWVSLFNGENLDGWIPKIYHHEVGDNYANTFRVKNQKILVNYDNYKEFGNRYGHLFYKNPFSSFHLKFKYRFTDQWLTDAPSYTYRNSGVMFHSQDP